MKKLLAAFFVACTMTLLMTSVSANEVLVNFDYDEGGNYALTVMNSGGIAPDGDVYIAVKASDGTLKSVKKLPITWISNRFANSGTLEMEANDTVDAYVWNDNMYPLDTVVSEDVVLSIADYAGVTNKSIEFFRTETSSSTNEYKLENDVCFLVNGVEIEFSPQNCMCYIGENNQNETVTLTDTTDNGYYDYIEVTYLADAVVSEIIGDKIYFGTYHPLMDSYMDVSEAECTFIRNGEEISFDDVMEQDVLSVAWDIRKGVADSEFYEVYVTSEWIGGICTAAKYDSFGNRKITMNNGMEYLEGYICEDSFYAGSQGYIALNCYGEYVLAKSFINVEEIAIVERFYTNAGYTYVRLINENGEKVDYILEEDRADLFGNGMDLNRSYTDYDLPIEERTVRYRINNNGNCVIEEKLSLLDVSPAVRVMGEYNALTKQIGSYKISDNSLILNAVSYANDSAAFVGKSNIADFVDEQMYDVVLAGIKDEDGVYPYVIVIDGMKEPEDNSTVVSTGTAIVDRFYISAGENMVRLIDENGEKLAYVLERDKTGLLNNVMESNRAYDDADLPIEERLVNYIVYSSGKCVLKSIASTVRVNDTYNDLAFSNYKLSETCIVLNASEYANDVNEHVRAISVDSLLDELEYEVILADEKDGKYQLVYVIDGLDSFSAYNEMAVFDSYDVIMNDGECYDEMTVYVSGEQKKVLCYEGTVTMSALEKGDAIVYIKDSYGYVEELIKINDIPNDEVLYNRSEVLPYIANETIINEDIWMLDFMGGDVEFIYAPVLNVSANSIELAELSGDYLSTAAGITYRFDSDVDLYRYMGYSIEVINSDDISNGTFKSIITSDAYTDNQEINWVNENIEANYAVVRLVDGKADDVYFITNDYSEPVEGEVYATDFSSIHGNEIEFYINSTSSKTVSYELDNTAALAVNGVEVALNHETCMTFLANNHPSEKVEFLDWNNNGKIDYVSVNYLTTAVVDEVIWSDSQIAKIMFDEYEPILGSAGLKVDLLSASDKSYKFIKNGQEISVWDLKQNDVLSISFDVTAYDVNDSEFITAYVTEGTEFGTCTKVGEDYSGMYFGISNEAYNDTYYCSNAYDGVMELGSNYEFGVNVYGDIAWAEMIANTDNYAIVDRFYTSAGNTFVRLINNKGEKVAYILKDDQTGLLNNYGGMQSNRSYSYEEFPFEDRIVIYSVNANDECVLKDIVSPAGVDTDVFMPSSNRIGVVKLSRDTTILDASAYADDVMKDVYCMNLYNLMPEQEYTVVYAGEKLADSSYPFVVIVKGNNGYSSNSPLAVVLERGEVYRGNELYETVTVYEKGMRTELICEWGVLSEAQVYEGDAIIYKKNYDGYVDEIIRITKMGTNEIAFCDRDALAYASTANRYANSEMIADEIDYIDFGNDDVSFVFGPVLYRDATSIEIANVNYNSDYNCYTSSDTGLSWYYDYPEIYKFDANGREGYLTDIITAGEVLKSTVPHYAYVDDNNTIDWNNYSVSVNYALLKIVNGEVWDVYSIIPSHRAGSTTINPVSLSLSWAMSYTDN